MLYKYLDTIGQRFNLYQIITDNGVAWQIVGVRTSEEGIWYELVCADGLGREDNGSRVWRQ